MSECGRPNISLQRTSSRRLAAAELGSFGGWFRVAVEYLG